MPFMQASASIQANILKQTYYILMLTYAEAVM